MHLLAAGGLSPVLVAALAGGGDRADLQVRRDGELARRAVHVAPRQPCHARQNGEEDAVGLELADVGDEVAGRAARLDAELRAAPPPPAGRAPSRTGRRRTRSRRRSRRARGRARAARSPAGRATTTRFPPRSCSAWRRSFRQSNRNVARCSGSRSARRAAGVEHEHGHDALERVQRRAQRRMVVHARSRRNQTRAVEAIIRPTGRAVDWIVVELVRDFPLFPLGLVAVPSELIRSTSSRSATRRWSRAAWRRSPSSGSSGSPTTACARSAARARSPRCSSACPTGGSTSSPAAPGRSGSRPARTSWPTRRAPSSSSPTVTRTWTTMPPRPPTAPTPSSSSRPRRRRRDPVEIAALTAYEMAATVEFGLDAKQGLLDLRSETARMKLVARLCRAAIKRLDYRPRAGPRAVERQSPLHGLNSARTDSSVVMSRGMTPSSSASAGFAPCRSSSSIRPRSLLCAAVCSGV